MTLVTYVITLSLWFQRVVQGKGLERAPRVLLLFSFIASQWQMALLISFPLWLEAHVHCEPLQQAQDTMGRVDLTSALPTDSSPVWCSWETLGRKEVSVTCFSLVWMLLGGGRGKRSFRGRMKSQVLSTHGSSFQVASLDRPSSSEAVASIHTQLPLDTALPAL